MVGLGGTVHRITSDVVCTFSIAPASRSVPVAGVQASAVEVTAPPGCDWTARSNDQWITIGSGLSGSGDGEVVFSVASNYQSATTRVGTLTIAGRTFTVTEAGCSISVSPTSRSVPVGGVQNVAASVSAPAGCGWTAVSDDSWITIGNGQSHTGSGQVLFSVAPNFGSTAQRTGTMTIAGRTFTVTESGCTFTLSPSSRAVPVTGVQNAAASVTAPVGCGWTAVSNDPWIAIQNGQSHTGNGQVVFSVAPNQGSTTSRVGTMTIAGTTFTVTEAGCTYALGTTSRSVPVGGIQGAVVGVTTSAGCGWTATGTDAWITITSGRSGSGNGQVIFSVAGNQASTESRTGTLTIADRTFTVVEAGCTYTLGATSRAVGASGIQNSAVAVGAPAGCPWTAVSNVAWITVTSGQNGTGNGQVVFSVASNQGGARSGTLTIGGRMFTVNEAGSP